MTRGDHAPPDLAGLTDALLAAARAAGATEADVAFIGSRSARVARLTTNSPVASMLRSVSLAPMLAKPTIGGT